ncbi:hypothetical protein [Pseudoalteromonas luteoviolacea]|uniref:DUF2846 domain-containing protein n=1 Tax=Pseudoalteromonas luteoviolacea S4060-1 TaxID=1365257 RepID=A0A167L643_9GAMM|nr:hypothetical protein [Pseudoalteromonas luteoviolacea]KZN63876.1 hypothetical protein N478_23295 [Pseudoalteromonas luteoviolacea S4060-1]
MKVIFILALFLLTGCQSTKVISPKLPDTAKESDISKLVLFMESNLKIGESRVYFGEKKKNYASFNKKGKKELMLLSGEYKFEIWSPGSATHNLEAVLEGNKTTCIRIFSNSTNLVGKFVVPLLRNLTSTHEAEVVDCYKINELGEDSVENS